MFLFSRQDFMIYMDDWPTLCKMDSDKDNRTNGEELGDPNCTWINKDERVAVSHPGNHIILTVSGSVAVSHPGNHVILTLYGSLAVSHPSNHFILTVSRSVAVCHTGYQVILLMSGSVTVSNPGSYDRLMLI